MNKIFKNKYLMMFLSLMGAISAEISFCRRWLFQSSKRLCEFINGFALVTFSSIMFCGHSEVVLNYPYRKFTYIANDHIWVAIFFLGVYQLKLMLNPSCLSTQKSGIVLHVSSIIWAVFAITFGLDYPPITTALPIYSLLSFITICAGHESINCGKYREFKKCTIKK